jgi:hypothetical protein
VIVLRSGPHVRPRGSRVATDAAIVICPEVDRVRVDASTRIVLNGTLAGGVTLVQVGDAERPFLLRNTWPGRLAGGASSNPGGVT